MLFSVGWAICLRVVKGGSGSCVVDLGCNALIDGGCGVVAFAVRVPGDGTCVAAVLDAKPPDAACCIASVRCKKSDFCVVRG